VVGEVVYVSTDPLELVGSVVGGGHDFAFLGIVR